MSIDRRTDLALVSADVPAVDEPEPAPAIPDSAHLLGLDSDSDREVAVDRHVTLVVDHATDQATYRRDVVIFTPGVADGDSGRLVGPVIADQEGEGVAVTVDEVNTVLAAAMAADDLTWPDPSNTC